MALVAALVLAVGVGLLVWWPGRPGRATAAAFEHVHGLGVNPADGVLYAATHHGLYRLPDAETPVRVGAAQDFMGFTVVGPDRFLASGHPASTGSEPSSVGLIESSDGGRTWDTRSLPGQADFHALDVSNGTVYGYNATAGTVMVSGDGQTWADTPLDGVADLAVNPGDAQQSLATTADGVARSRDRGRTFDPPAGPVLLLLSWTSDGTLVGVTPQGLVQSSRDTGRTWQTHGTVGGAPEALTADGDTVHVAVDGRVLSSTDRGETFTARGPS